MKTPLDTPAQRVHPSRGMGHRQMPLYNAPGVGRSQTAPNSQPLDVNEGAISPDIERLNATSAGTLDHSAAGDRPRRAGAPVGGSTRRGSGLYGSSPVGSSPRCPLCGAPRTSGEERFRQRRNRVGTLGTELTTAGNLVGAQATSEGRGDVSLRAEGFLVTSQWVHRCATKPCGVGWTRQQLAILGVPWPPPRGWLSRLRGRVITEAQRSAFEAFSYARTSPELPR